MTMTNPFLLFCVDEGRYALDVAAVERIVPAAEVIPLPGASEAVVGLVNIAGDITPVVDARWCFRFPRREMELSDRFIVTQASGRSLALLVDKVEGVVELSTRALDNAGADLSDDATPAAAIPGGIVLIRSIDEFAVAAGLTNGGTRREKNGVVE